MSIPDGTYLLYSLGVETSVFAGEFSILEIKENNTKLVIQTRTGAPATLTKKDTGWTGAGYTIEARLGTIRSNNMMIGTAALQAPGKISSFVAIQLQADLSPILIDNAATAYEIFFQDGSNDGDLRVEPKGSALTFNFKLNNVPQASTTRPDQSPGRFSALKDNEQGRDLHGFVLPHRLWDGGKAYRVLLGHARKPSELPGPDDIDPYIAVSVSPGPSPQDEG